MFYVLDGNLNKLAEITSYYNLIWNPVYLDKSGGSFEFELPYATYSYLQKNYIIYNDEDRLFGIISDIRIEETFNEDLRKTIKVSGEMGASLLKNRILYPLVNRKGECYKVLSELIYEYFVSSSIPGRNIPNLEYQPDTTLNYEVEISVEGVTLADVYESLLSTGKAGYKMYLELEDKKFILQMYKGKDISDRFVFCKEDNNLQDFIYQTSNENQYTTCIVAGKDKSCAVVDWSSQKGLYRKEIFLNKSSESNENLSENAYQSQLYYAGSNELLNHQISEAIEFNIVNNIYSYTIDYNLGDIVTVRNDELGIEKKLFILGILINYDENGNKETTLTLGDISEIELEYKKEEEKKFEDVANNGGNTSSSDSDISTDSSSYDSVSKEYIPVLAENHKSSKIIGGIFKIDNNQYLFQLTCNESSSEEIGRIYYECEEDLLGLEKILHINLSTYINCPGTKVKNKYVYDTYGTMNYFSYSKIITRDKTPDLDPSIVLYDMGKFTLKDITFDKTYGLSTTDRLSCKDGTNAYAMYKENDYVWASYCASYNGKTLTYYYGDYGSLDLVLTYNLYDCDMNYKNYIDSICSGSINFKLIRNEHIGNIYYNINGGKKRKYETDGIITLSKGDYINLYTDLNQIGLGEITVTNVTESVKMKNVKFGAVYDKEQNVSVAIYENLAPLPISNGTEMTGNEFCTWMGGYDKTVTMNSEYKKSDIINAGYV